MPSASHERREPRRAFRRSLTLLTAVGMLAASLAGGAQAASCARPAEVQAIQTRVLQSELMVAALSCGAREGYNRFARKFQAELVDGGRTLKAYFKRSYGGRAERELNGFITRLANQASQKSIAQGPHYCRKALARLDSVLALPTDGLRYRAVAFQPTTATGVAACEERVADGKPAAGPKLAAE